MASKRVFIGGGRAAGFTLVEVMVVLLLLGIVSVGLFQMLTTSRASYDRQKITLEMQTNARAALEAVASDFRHVSYGKDPTQPSIHYAGADSVTFIADILPDIPGAEQISYALSSDGDPDTPNPNDTILMKSVADSSGQILFAEPQSYGMRADGLQIRYFNGAAVELASPVAHPELIGEILVEVTSMEPRAHARLGTYLEETLSATIYPRNLPLTPARSRPSRPAIGTLAFPDCQSATVPWMRPTTYTDGTALPISEISNFTLYVGTDPDELQVHSRLARTMTQWTVDGLIGGQTYYFAVTCTSTSDVESFYNLITLDLSSPLTPDLPTNPVWTPNPGGPGVNVAWNAVTTFDDGSVISTPVTYHVYRGTAANVLPVAGNLLATVPVNTSYVDTTTADCSDYFYIVTAEACGNEGSPSAEITASRPGPPSCVAAVAAHEEATAGDVHVTWAQPTGRSDGTALDPADITGYRIYYGLTPNNYTDRVDVAATPAECVLAGLTTCETYYFNVACLDACGHEGSLCPYNEASATTTEECDPDVPATVAFLRARPLVDRVELAWPANTTDCDLAGYRIYYGQTPGGPYNGAGAAEGASPILVSSAAVLDGDSCRAALTDLPYCEDIVVTVAAVDRCDPMNEGGLAPEVSFQTYCTPCMADAGCVRYLATGATFTQVRFEVYPTDAAALTMTELLPVWTGPALAQQVWAGRPLVKVWDCNGSAGGDGNVGPLPSGSTLNLNDVTIPGTGTCAYGLPMMISFNGDQRLQTLDLTFVEGSDVCNATPRLIAENILFDDFDDGNYTGWQVLSGTWSAASGAAYQSSSTGVRTLIWPTTFVNFTYEVKLKNTAGQTPYMIFRYLDENNFYLFGLRTTDNTVRLCKYQGGTFIVMDQVTLNVANNIWYLLRVDVEGTTVKAYLDCEQLFSVNDPQIRPNGKLGMRDYSSRTYFDDVRVSVIGEDLP